MVEDPFIPLLQDRNHTYVNYASNNKSEIYLLPGIFRFEEFLYFGYKIRSSKRRSHGYYCIVVQLNNMDVNVIHYCCFFLEIISSFPLFPFSFTSRSRG